MWLRCHLHELFLFAVYSSSHEVSFKIVLKNLKLIDSELKEMIEALYMCVFWGPYLVKDLQDKDSIYGKKKYHQEQFL